MKLATTTGDFGRYTNDQAEAVRYIREAGFLYLDYNFNLDYKRGNGFFGNDPAAHLSSMKKAGIRPMLHGFIISALVVVVALAVEFFMGLL